MWRPERVPTRRRGAAALGPRGPGALLRPRGHRLLATADAELVPEPAPRSELSPRLGPGSRVPGPLLPWPPNKPERKRCIVSTRRMDRINLKSKGPLPARPTPLPTPWPYHSSWGCFPAARSARAGVGLASSSQLLCLPRKFLAPIPSFACLDRPSPYLSGPAALPAPPLLHSPSTHILGAAA